MAGGARRLSGEPSALSRVAKISIDDSAFVARSERRQLAGVNGLVIASAGERRRRGAKRGASQKCILLRSGARRRLAAMTFHAESELRVAYGFISYLNAPASSIGEAESRGNAYRLSSRKVTSVACHGYGVARTRALPSASSGGMSAISARRLLAAAASA